MAHSSKTKNEKPAAFQQAADLDMPNEQITVTKQASDKNTRPLMPEVSVENLGRSFKPIASTINPIKPGHTITRNIKKQLHKKTQEGVDLERDVIAYLALVAIIGLLVALTKIFGLQYTIAVCLIITFVAVSVFLLIRAQINKDPRLLTGDL